MTAAEIRHLHENANQAKLPVVERVRDESCETEDENVAKSGWIEEADVGVARWSLQSLVSKPGLFTRISPSLGSGS